MKTAPARLALLLTTLGHALPSQDPAIVVVVKPGTWSLPGGATLEVACRLFHGADVQTTATTRWAGSDKALPLHHRVDVAADAFGVREPWCIAFGRDAATLWVFRGKLGGSADGRAHLLSATRVELSDPGAIKTIRAEGVWPDTLVPDAIADAVRQRFALPPTDGRPLPEPSVARAEPEPPLEVLCRVRLLDTAGEPMAGSEVRFPAIVGTEVGRSTIGDPASGDVRPRANAGLSTTAAATSTEGWALALAPLARAAAERGAIIRPMLGAAGKRRGILKPIRVVPEQLDQLEERSRGEGTLEGRLVDGDGRPLGGVTVAACRLIREDDPSGIALPVHTRTADDGRFAIKHVPADVPLHVVARRDGRTLVLPGAVSAAAVSGTPAPELRIVWAEGVLQRGR